MDTGTLSRECTTPDDAVDAVLVRLCSGDESDSRSFCSCTGFFPPRFWLLSLSFDSVHRSSYLSKKSSYFLKLKLVSLAGSPKNILPWFDGVRLILHLWTSVSLSYKMRLVIQLHIFQLRRKQDSYINELWETWIYKTSEGDAWVSQSKCLSDETSITLSGASANLGEELSFLATWMTLKHTTFQFCSPWVRALSPGTTGVFCFIAWCKRLRNDT